MKKLFFVSMMSLSLLSFLNAKSAMDVTLRDCVNAAQIAQQTVNSGVNYASDKVRDFIGKHPQAPVCIAVGTYAAVVCCAAYVALPSFRQKIKNFKNRIKSIVTSTPVQAAMFGFVGGVVGSRYL